MFRNLERTNAARTRKLPGLNKKRKLDFFLLQRVQNENKRKIRISRTSSLNQKRLDASN